ncbi:MAG TPA: hypothetical protein VIV60_17905 [Polyangiaceae bacterium]
MELKKSALQLRDTGEVIPLGIVESIMYAATLAPSGRNGQPWRWQLLQNSVRLLCTDPETLTDYRHCGALAGLGAALENLILAAHHHQLEISIDVFPDPSDASYVADIGFYRNPTHGTEPHEYDELYGSLRERCTNRKLGDGQPLEPSALSSIEAAAKSIPGTNVRLHTSRSVVDDLANIMGCAGSLQLFDEHFHRELVSELRWTAEEAERTRDGIDVETLELTTSDRFGLTLAKSWTFAQALRRVGGSKVIERLFAKPVRASAAFGLIWRDESDPKDYLLGGRAMERAWLRTSQLGLSIYPVSTLPYFFARLIRGNGIGMSKRMRNGVQRLRARYSEHFAVTDRSGEIISFCIMRSGPVSKRALRKPLEQVVEIIE